MQEVDCVLNPGGYARRAWVVFFWNRLAGAPSSPYVLESMQRVNALLAYLIAGPIKLDDQSTKAKSLCVPTTNVQKLQMQYSMFHLFVLLL